MNQTTLAIDNNVLAKLEARASASGMTVEEYISYFFDTMG